MWEQAREQFSPCLFFMHLENHMTVQTGYSPGEVRFARQGAAHGNPPRGVGSQANREDRTAK